MTEFKRENKYEVFKLEDIDKYLTDSQKIELAVINKFIREGRQIDGKVPCNRYIVVNQDEPYSETIWKLIETTEITRKEE